MTIVYPVLFSLVLCSIVMILVWVWASKIQNAGVVDIFWAFCFSLVAVLLFFMADGALVRKMLVTGILFLWGCRLGIYLLLRVGTHLEVEEGRYAQLRKEWQPHPDKKFFAFFQMQAFSVVFLCIPFFITTANSQSGLSTMEYIGAALWLISIVGEGISDWQLKKFKSNLLNKGKVCQYGLWNYSRHPNYFFQLMIWISVCITSLSSPYGWLSVVCPLTIGYLIFKVTGIPMTEEQAIRSKGEAYKEYQRTTSVFIPSFKKNK